MFNSRERERELNISIYSFHLRYSVFLFSKDEYELFKAGKMGHRNDHIIIHGEAYPKFDIFSDAKFYANSKYHGVTLIHKMHSQIYVSPVKKQCTATFYFGSNQFEYLPENYHEYYITIEEGANVTARDMDAVMRWKLANVIVVDGYDDLNVELAKRGHDLRLINIQTTQMILENVKFYTRTTFDSYVIPNVDKLPADAFRAKAACP